MKSSYQLISNGPVFSRILLGVFFILASCANPSGYAISDQGQDCSVSLVKKARISVTEVFLDQKKLLSEGRTVLEAERFTAPSETKEIKIAFSFLDRMCRRDPSSTKGGCISGYSCNIPVGLKPGTSYELHIGGNLAELYPLPKSDLPIVLTDCEAIY
ncbi:MAG TPA: hypothetical protein PKA63_11975 [Oligoflexia bacterium]|nr:hypothetical protein [Oligoflexia bacterium]HMP49372.1 hypothetical protein [Oligoflexia bacterium]